MRIREGLPSRTSNGFTLVELLFILAVIAMMAGLMLPVLAKARQSPQASQCLSNERQLMLAALMYADDNSGVWFPNQPAGGNPAQLDWVTSSLNFSLANPSNTNLAALANPATDFFAKYIQSPLIFHCPADHSLILGQGQRVRSVSASGAVGTQWQGVCAHLAGDPVTGQWLTGANTDCDGTWRRYGKASDMVTPAPSALWVFADEDSSSIGDPEFAVECSATTLGGARWIDLPAHYHDGAVSISFADGHAELHRWTGSLLSWPVVWNGPGYPGDPSISTLADLQDINWLQQRTSTKVN